MVRRGVLALAVIAGCGSVDDRARGDGGAGADAGRTDGGDGDGGPPPPPCDPDERPDESDGVFVSPTGAPTNDGSAATPVDSIEAAIVIARTVGRTRVYLDAGTYAESVQIEDSPEGVFVEGGWRSEGISWSRNCDPDAALQTVIRSPDPVAVTFQDVTHPSGLSLLTVQTAPRALKPGADTAGGSRIAVLVRGEGSSVRLLGVQLLPAAGDHGGPATAGTAGAAPACGGRVDCSNGAAGTPGAAGADAPGTGTFDARGYGPVDGEAGVGAGTDGANGTGGDAANQSRSDCNTGCSCGTCTTSWSGSDYNGTETSTGGSCGCGGKAGGPGAAGRGGGASVALLVVGKNATVDVQNSLLRSGDGGDGSPGGVGGTGSEGTAGGASTDVRCHRMDCIGGCGGGDCSYNPVDPAPLIDAANGGSGGRGGDGGAGGGGAGGPSYSVVTVGGARIVRSESVLAHGDGGAGGNGAPGGASGETLDAL